MSIRLHRVSLPWLAVVAALTILSTPLSAKAPDPLPSWNSTAPKQAILSFVRRVTTKGSSGYIPTAERIATFDNDGTLWGEQPMYVQLAYAMDRVKTLAPQHPEWKTKEPFASLLNGDIKPALSGGAGSSLEAILATDAGLTPAESEKIVLHWLATARHPKTGRPYTEMVYQPMLELLAYLRANGFKTYIVSGGVVDFMRPWTEKIYGVPPEQIIGSSGKMKFEMHNGKPELVYLPEVDFIDDKPGKPIGINKFIGRRPVMAFGNSDGDLPMLQWAAAGNGARFCLYIHHTDDKREWAYDRTSSIGRLDKGLDEALQKHWTVVDMKADWKIIYPFEMK